MNWQNWSGRLSSHPAIIEALQNEAAVVQAVRDARERGHRIRCFGASHSHAPLVVTDETLLDLSSLSGLIEVDTARREALVLAGTRIAQLGPLLDAAGLALHNQGDIDRQSIAGAVATGTHGTGPELRNLSASVLGAQIVLAEGTVLECDATREPELFEVCRLSLGAVGVVTRLRLSVRDSYRLEEKMWIENLDQVLDRIGVLTRATRHFEFFWQPGKDRALCKSLEETNEACRYPLAAEGARLARSFEVLANQRNDKHTEMEYSLPAERGPDCLRALREMLTREFPDLAWPIEYRTLAPDDVWMSTAYQRPSVTISVHQGIEQDDEAVFRASEEIFRSFDGRPHWGKVHFLRGEDLASIHAKWADWWRVRDHYDPEDLFLNPYLASFTGRARRAAIG